MYASWRLPGSGAGPSPDRLLLGSEGTLGVITEAWMRVRPRPSQRASASVAFGDLFSALEALREITQSGLRPANCRVLDEGEAQLAGAGDGEQSVLVLGFESSGVPVDRDLADAIELAADHGGVAPRGERRRGARRRRRRVAQRVPAHALRARRPGPHGRDQRHVRDRDDVGARAGI